MNTFKFKKAEFTTETGAVTIIVQCITPGVFNGTEKLIQSSEAALRARIPAEEAGRPWGNTECLAEAHDWLIAKGEASVDVIDPTPE
jgi:hypothetical protein